MCTASYQRGAVQHEVSLKTNRTRSGNRDRDAESSCNRRLVIHLWAGEARRVELKAVHLWVSYT